jgi:hypothetical protein
LIMLRAAALKTVVVSAASLIGCAAVAQTAPSVPALNLPAPAALAAPAVPASAPPATTAAPVGVTPAPAAKAVARSTPGKREDCTRLPLSDIAFGREATIAQARMRLGEYADKEAKKRGWATYVKSAEVSSCEVYIDFGPLVGTEYKCLLAATFCRK